jgi:DNA-binding HxlR family transcriptional regulator
MPYSSLVADGCCSLWQILKKTIEIRELKKSINHITERMLTLQLREMEADSIIKRTIFPEVPPRVEL